MKSKRLAPSDRKAELLACALRLAQRGHYASITRDAIATEAGVSSGLVSKYLGTMPAMRRLVMRHAIKAECLIVLGQGLAAGDKYARGAPGGLRVKAAQRLAA